MGSLTKTEFLDQPFNGYRVICGAMIIGTAVMAVLFLFIFDWEKLNTSLDMLAMIGLIIGITSCIVSFVVPGIINNAALKMTSRKLDDEGCKFDSETGLRKIFATRQSASIVRYAILEGAVFAYVVFFYVTGSVFSLVTVAIGMLIMIAMFPRKDATLAWVERAANDMIQGRV